MTCADHADTDAETPTGYIDCADWMTEKGKTHLQYRCPECGRYKIWLSRETVQAIRNGHWAPSAASRR